MTNQVHPNDAPSTTKNTAAIESSQGGFCTELFNPTGEANPVATKRELRGWYWYEFGTAAYFVGAQDFISIFCVNLAKDYARRTYCESEFGANLGDSNNHSERLAFETCIERGWALDFENEGTCIGVTTIYKTNMTCVENDGTWQPTWKDGPHKVPLFGLSVGYTATYTTSVTISIVFQLAMFLLFGSMGDFGNKRKTMFFFSNNVSVIALALIAVASKDTMYEYALALNIVVQTFLNFSTVLYNSWLPLLAAATPEARTAAKTITDGDELYKIRSKINAEIASKGVGSNFLGAVCFLSIAVLMLNFLSSAMEEMDVIRLVFLCAAAWLFSLSTFASVRLQTRPGPPVPRGQSYASLGMKEMTSTFKEWRRLPNLFMFLAAYFVYSDGVSTLTNAAAVFASEELGMTFSELIYSYFIVSVGAGTSAVGLTALHKRFGWTKKSMLCLSLIITGLIPLYASFALKTKIEFYLIVLLFALNYGCIQVFTRSLFSSLIPKGYEANFFSLFQLSDKGTAWAGPLMLSVVSSSTGSFRNAFISLASFFYLGLFMLMLFSPKKALKEKEDFDRLEQRVTRSFSNKQQQQS